MADFFQPGNASQNQVATNTPSPADQAMAMFKAQLFQALLNNAAGNRPTFKSFVEGGPASRPVPQGLGNGLADVLMAMKQPGAFTSQATSNTEVQPPSPSMFSDLTQLGLLGAMLYQSGALGAIGGGAKSILDKFLGGPVEIGNYDGLLNPDTAASMNQNQDNFLNSIFNTMSPDNQVPMANAGAAQDDFLAAILQSMSY